MVQSKRPGLKSLFTTLQQNIINSLRTIIPPIPGRHLLPPVTPIRERQITKEEYYEKLTIMLYSDAFSSFTKQLSNTSSKHKFSLLFDTSKEFMHDITVFWSAYRAKIGHPGASHEFKDLSWDELLEMRKWIRDERVRQIITEAITKMKEHPRKPEKPFQEWAMRMNDVDCHEQKMRFERMWKWIVNNSKKK